MTDEQKTFRQRFREEAGKLYNIYLIRPYDASDKLPLPGYSIAKWGIEATEEAFDDQTIRFLDIPYAHARFDHDLDLLGKTNCDALRELDETDALGWINDSLLVLDLDAIATEPLADAILGLEDYPIVDEEALSMAELEEDDDCWEQWQRRDVCRELTKQFGVPVESEGTELDDKLREAASQQGRSSEESDDRIIENLLCSMSPLPFWPDDPNVTHREHRRKRIESGKVPTLAFALSCGAIVDDDEQPLADQLPNRGAILSEVDAREALAKVLGEIEPDDANMLVAAMRFLYDKANPQPSLFE